MKKGIKLNHNFLNEVIFRINFTTIDELLENNQDAINIFKENLFDRFPNLEVVPQKTINLTIDTETNFSEKKTENKLCWILRNKEGNKQITVTATNLILDYYRGAYTGFEDFYEEIAVLLKILDKYNPEKINFLGLRYINEINDDEINHNIEKYINSSLFNSNILNDLKTENEELIQIFSKLDFQNNDCMLTMQYGFFNPTFKSTHEKHFILDYDCINQDINEIKEVKNTLKKMNMLIFNKFEYSITKELEKRIR